MRLVAIATAAGVPDGGFAGSVAHVYPRLCLLGLADQSLVTLATSAVGHLPRGITLDSSAEFLSHVAPGSAFAARAGILRFSASTLSVDLRRSHRWQCNLPSLKLDINNVPVRQAWQAARDALRRDGRSSGLQRAAGSTIRDLAAATRGFAAGAAGEIVAALIGLGEGTTPAADDFLVGYVAGLLSSVGIIEARAHLVLTLCEQFKAAASRTHRVSRLYLEAAAEGQISERLYALATCIATGAGEETVTFAAEAALNVGHSSGACGILGLLIGCSAWEE